MTSRSPWKALGTAIDITMTLENPHLDAPVCVSIPPLPAHNITKCKIKHPSGHQPSILDEFKNDSRFSILYSDLFGNRLESKYEKGNVAIRTFERKT